MSAVSAAVAAPPAALAFCDGDYPAHFGFADAVSRRNRSGYVRALGATFLLLAMAIALVAVTLRLAGEGAVWPRLLAGAAIAAAILVAGWGRWRGFDRRWFDGRAAAETAKSLTWRFMLGVPPFAGDDLLAAATLLAALDETIAARPSLAVIALPGRDEAITPGMRQVRSLPPDARTRLYRAVRIEDQISWYAAKATANQRWSVMWFRLALAGMALALVAALGLRGEGGVALVALPATLAAAALAWAQLGRFDELRTSYDMAATELRDLAHRLDRASIEADWLRLIEETELAISREHTMAIAKRR